MSNPKVKAENSKFKDIKQGITPQIEHLYRGRKARQQRLWKVMGFSKIFPKAGGWYLAHRCESEQAAHKWVEKSLRGYGKKEAGQYKIIGPVEGSTRSTI